MKGRSLEDINEMFDKGVPTRQFGGYVLEHKTEGKGDEQEIVEIQKVEIDGSADKSRL